MRLDLRFAQHLKGSDGFPGPAEAILRERGAPEECYVLAADSDLDGREMPLMEALNAVSGSTDGAFLSSIPGRLGFYQFAGMKLSYLLTR